MTAFNYTTGNPSNLTAGTTASMNDIQGPFTDLKTFLNNGANLDDANFVATAGMYTANRQIMRVAGVVNGGTTAGTYIFTPENLTTATAISAGAPPLMHAALASSYAITGRTTKLRMRALTVCNATSAGVNFNFSLQPITASAGGAGVLSLTLGASVGTGATISPSANSTQVSNAADYSYSALTDNVAYVLTLAPGGTTAANSQVLAQVIIELHWA